MIFTVPKVWATQEDIFPAQLNQLLAAIQSSANSIVDAQVSATAAIEGTKLADDSVLTEKFNDGAVTIAKLAVGATVSAAVGVQQFTLPQVNPGASEALADVFITVRGAPVLLAYGWSGDASVGATRTVTTSLLALSDLQTLGTYAQSISTGKGRTPIAACGFGLQIPLFSGDHQYRLSVAITGTAGVDVVRPSRAYLVALEMA